MYQSHANQGGFSALISLPYGENLSWRVKRGWPAKGRHARVGNEGAGVPYARGLDSSLSADGLLHGVGASAPGRRP